MAGKSSKPAAFAPARGAPPSIEWQGVANLDVDPAYQRSTEAQDSRTAIRRIADRWDWRLCAPLTVSRREAGLFVIDGQHRLEAARLRGDIPHLPCIISTFASLAEEAACFVAINTNRRKVTALDTFRAELAAGDEKALAINRLVTDAGLTLARHTNNAGWKPGQVGAIQGIRGAFNRYGPAVVGAALGDLATAFPGKVLGQSGALLRGLFPINANPPADFEREHFRKMLGARSQTDWCRAMFQRQAKHGELLDSAMHYAMLDAWSAWQRKAAA